MKEYHLRRQAETSRIPDYVPITLAERVAILNPAAAKKPRRRRKRPKPSPHRARYLAYLQSDEWMAVRERLFAARGRICERCGAKKRLHVHHKHYRNLFSELDEDLEILCSGCHMAEHSEKRLATR